MGVSDTTMGNRATIITANGEGGLTPDREAQGENLKRASGMSLRLPLRRSSQENRLRAVDASPVSTNCSRVSVKTAGNHKSEPALPPAIVHANSFDSIGMEFKIAEAEETFRALSEEEDTEEELSLLILPAPYPLPNMNLFEPKTIAHDGEQPFGVDPNFIRLNAQFSGKRNRPAPIFA